MKSCYSNLTNICCKIISVNFLKWNYMMVQSPSDLFIIMGNFYRQKQTVELDFMLITKKYAQTLSMIICKKR